MRTCWGAHLQMSLAVSPARRSLEEVHLRGVVWERCLEEAVPAASHRMNALRQLKMAGVEWTFMCGAVVGRSPRSVEG